MRNNNILYVMYRRNTAKAELMAMDGDLDGYPVDCLNGDRAPDTTDDAGNPVQRKNTEYSEYEAYLIDALYAHEALCTKRKKPADFMDMEYKSDFPEEDFKILWLEMPREELVASVTDNGNGGRKAEDASRILRSGNMRYRDNFFLAGCSGRKIIRGMPISLEIKHDEEDTRSTGEKRKIDHIKQVSDGTTTARNITGYGIMFHKGMITGQSFPVPANLQAQLKALKLEKPDLFPEAEERRYQVNTALARKFFLYFGLHKSQAGKNTIPLKDMFREIRPSLVRSSGTLRSEEKAIKLAGQLAEIYKAITDCLPECAVPVITKYEAIPSSTEKMKNRKSIKHPAVLVIEHRAVTERKTDWRKVNKNKLGAQEKKHGYKHYKNKFKPR